MIYLLSACVAFLLTFWLCRHLANPASSLFVADVPNHRSLHAKPCPRNGGLAILAGSSLGVGLVWLMDAPRFPGGGFLVLGLVSAVVVSFLDDKYPLSQSPRLLIQLCAAILLMGGGFSVSELVIPGMGRIALGWFGLPFSLLFVVWMMNLYNFMDGMDGFAGGMGAFGFGFLALLGWQAGEWFFFATALTLAVANTGFLLHNFPSPTARIFMGDVGSVPMGFLAASLSLWGVQKGVFDLWVSVLVFSPFIVDATVTVIRRGLRGEKVWQAHRSHYYQRLVISGWNHQKTVLYEYGLMCGFGGLAVFLWSSHDEAIQSVGLIASGVVYIVLARLVDRKTSHVQWS